MTDQPTYPYSDGVRAVLGPDVTATADGSTITWQGATYRRDRGETHCTCGAVRPAEGTESPLRDLLARAIESADEHSCQMQDGPDYQTLGAAAAAAILPTTRLLGELARSADADVKRVIDLHERWQQIDLPKDRESRFRWWDARLAELHDAILPPDNQPATAGDTGPSVAEAAADDRRWDLEKGGE